MATAESARSLLRVSRLVLYFEIARDLEVLGRETVTSADLEKLTGCRQDNIRQDFAAFGTLGQAGKGYDVRILRMNLERVLGADKVRPAVIVGSGAKADAVRLSAGFDGTYASIVGVFELDTAFVGTRVGKMTVQPIEELAATVQTHHVSVGVMVVPEELAQDAADLLVLAGVPSVINATNQVVRLPGSADVQQVNLASALHKLSFLQLERRREHRRNLAAADDLENSGGRLAGDARQVGVFEGDAAVEEE